MPYTIHEYFYDVWEDDDYDYDYDYYVESDVESDVVDKHLTVNGIQLTEGDKENIEQLFCSCGRSHELCTCDEEDL
jgi:hypothetical protein